MTTFNFLIFNIYFLFVGWAVTPAWTIDTSHEQIIESVDSSWQEVLAYAQENLPKEGTLIVKSDGFGYIDVDDDYIHQLFPLLGLEEEGFIKPPYFRTPEPIGAHISVFYVAENIIPEEINESFSFELERIVVVKPTADKSYVILEVKAPELEKLREKYGLSPKVFGQEYHISLAVKKEIEKS